MVINVGTKQIFNDKEIELLKASTRLNNMDNRKSLEEISQTLYEDTKHTKGVLTDLQNLGKKLGEYGVRLHEEDGNAWFEFSDLLENRMHTLLKEQRKGPEFFMYLCPPRGGMDSKVWDEYLALGINLFLTDNYPVIAGIQKSKQPLIKSLDGVVVMGGLASEVPQYNNTSDFAVFTVKILRQFKNGTLSPERVQTEKNRLETMMESDLPEDVKQKYGEKVAGLITTPLEAALYSAGLVETMFNGYEGPVIVQPGIEDDRNEKHFRTYLLKQITKSSQSYRRLESRINKLYTEAERAQVKRVLGLHLVEELQNAVDYIYGNKEEQEGRRDRLRKNPKNMTITEKRLLRAYNIDNKHHNDWERETNVEVIVNRMRYDPTEKRARRAFEFMFENYKRFAWDRLGEAYEWNEDYFEDLDDHLVEKIKKHETAGFGREVREQFGRMRTYLGMGNIMQHKQARVDGTDRILSKNESESDELKDDLAIKREALNALGWFDSNKLISDKNPQDVAMIEVMVQHMMNEYFDTALESVNGTVLNKGQNFFTIGQTSFWTRYNMMQEFPTADLRFKALLGRIGELNTKNEYVPDVLLTGPSPHGTLIGNERKYGQDKRQMPDFLFERDIETAMIFVLGGLYTDQAVEYFQKTKLADPIGFPRDFTTYGHLVLDFIDTDNLHHTYAISANELRQLAINHINKVMKKEPDKYYEGYWILRGDDAHFGMSQDPLQIPGEWFASAKLEYAMNRLFAGLGVPTVTTASELLDGKQKFRGMDSGYNDLGFSERQLEIAEKAIREAYPVEQSLDLVSMLNEMNRRGKQVPSLTKQKELFMESNYVDLFFAIAKAGTGHSILLPRSDHSARTELTVTVEPLEIQNLFKFANVETQQGVKSVADFMYPSMTADTSILGFVEGSLPDGQRVYAAHKMWWSGKANMRAGLLGNIALTAHKHHRYTQIVGDIFFDCAPGDAHTYPHINQAALAPANQSIAAAIIPNKMSFWKESRSVINGGADTIIYNQPAWMNLVEMRKDILSYVPVKR